MNDVRMCACGDFGHRDESWCARCDSCVDCCECGDFAPVASPEPALMTLARQTADRWWHVYRWDAGSAQGRVVERRMTLRLARRVMLREPLDEDDA